MPGGEVDELLPGDPQQFRRPAARYPALTKQVKDADFPYGLLHGLIFGPEEMTGILGNLQIHLDAAVFSYTSRAQRTVI